MGPRPRGRGVAVRNWPRRRERCFNGAATARSRSQIKRVAPRRRRLRLQWGRDRAVAESPRSGTRDKPYRLASMGPRPRGRGVRSRRRTPRSMPGCFNGAATARSRSQPLAQVLNCQGPGRAISSDHWKRVSAAHSTPVCDGAAPFFPTSCGTRAPRGPLASPRRSHLVAWAARSSVLCSRPVSSDSARIGRFNASRIPSTSAARRSRLAPATAPVSRAPGGS